jgi:N-acyl-phosphatidylethanolamine-hydrolysing phospholipase D
LAQPHVVEMIGNSALWLCPLGVGDLLTNLGITNYVEMNWWDTYEFKLPSSSDSSDATVVFVPAAHWTNRGLNDVNTCLWGGFCVKVNPKSKTKASSDTSSGDNGNGNDNANANANDSTNFFFMGDSGYNKEMYKHIGDKYGPFDCAGIGIGAYRPRDFMKSQHVTPLESCYTHQDIKSKFSVGIHWGTFPLALEDDIEPAFELGRARETCGLSHRDICTVDIGETYYVPSSTSTMEEKMTEQEQGPSDLATANPELFQRFLKVCPDGPYGDNSDILKWPFRP